MYVVTLPLSTHLRHYDCTPENTLQKPAVVSEVSKFSLLTRILIVFSMLGRHRDIGVETVTGPASLIFQCEVVTICESHRGYLGSQSSVFVEEDWKYYEFTDGESKQCQTFGNLKDGSGFYKGFTMWDPLCFPKALDSKRNDSSVICKKLLSENLPNKLCMVLD